MASYEDLRCAGSVTRYDPALLTPVDPRVFDLLRLAQHGRKMGSAPGRGEAQFVRLDHREKVLRPYLRGGLMRHVICDLFAGWLLEVARSMREFKLTSWMLTHGLPVPKVAAQIGWAGPLLYRAVILTEWIVGAQPLRTGPLDASSWRRIGQTVRKMHHTGVFHSDLNRRNIQLDGAGSVWLINFDKCARPVPGAWMQRNLDRSLCKDDGQGALLWSLADWTAFLEGYRKGVGP